MLMAGNRVFVEPSALSSHIKVLYFRVKSETVNPSL